MKKLANLFWNTTLYKIAVIWGMLLIPSYALCVFPQPVSIALLLWGAAILLRDLFTERNFLRQTGSMLLILFCVGYAITILLYAQNDLVSTVHLYCWNIVEFLVLLAVDNRKENSPKALLREIYTINSSVSLLALVTGALSLACFIWRVSAVLPDLEGVNGVWLLGVVNGRNSGIFNNPLPLANAMLVGCTASLFNLAYPKEKKKWYAVLMYVLTFVVCLLAMITTLARTHVFAIYILMFVAVFVGLFQWLLRKGMNPVLRVLVSLVAGGVAAVVLFGAGELGKAQLVKISSKVPPMDMQFLVELYEQDDNSADPVESDPTETTAPDSTDPTEPDSTDPDGTDPTDPDVTDPTEPDGTEPQETEPKKPTVVVGGYVNNTLVRDELERLPNFFYPRNELWKVAMQVVPHSPVFGFTSGNRQSSSLAYGTTPYFLAFEKVGIITYHNAYFDIAVSAGLLGLGLMLAFLAIQIIRTLRVIFSKKLHVLGKRETFGYAVLVGYLAIHVLVTSMFLGVLCFTNAVVCVYFWVMLGYASKLHDQILGGCGALSGEKLLKKFKK